MTMAEKELLRLTSKFRDYLVTERDRLVEIFCIPNDDADLTPNRSTMEPDDAEWVKEVEDLLDQVNSALRLYGPTD